MDIGIQRDKRVYLKGCDLRQWIDNAAWFLTSAILALMIMLTPAHAALESKAPLTGGETWKSTWWHLHNQVYPTADATCAADIPPWWSEPGSSYIYLGTTPVINPRASNLPEGSLTCQFRITTSYTYDTGFGGAYPWPYPTCQTPSTNPTIPFVYNATKNMCERTVPDVVKCPIDPFPDINDTDACTKSLEKGAGKDVDNACPALDPEMVKQGICLGNKIRRLGISYFEPSATVRTVAYQQHFVDLWKWHDQIEDEQESWSAAQKQVCTPMVAKVDAEWKKHGLDGKPSNSGPNAPHVLRKAVDINTDVVEAMEAELSKPYTIKPASPNCIYCDYIPVYIGDVQDYVNSPLFNPPACKLRWGGRFKGKKIDPVHFDLLLK